MSMTRSKESDEARQRAAEMMASGIGDVTGAITGGLTEKYKNNN